MLRYILLITMFLSLFQSVCRGEDKASLFTQKDFATLLLQQFSWINGLPKEPVDRDYLAILGGKRTFRYEAENAYNELTDRVTIRNYPLFGDFTGTGWVHGVSDATDATFTILIPIAGEYNIKGVIKGNGFVWSIDGKEYKADSKSGNFRETDITKITLKAGVLTIKVIIPPEGAIDSFSLTAPDYDSIQPFMGWRFKEGLTAARMAEISVAMTSSFARLPDINSSNSPTQIAVFDKTLLPLTATLTDASYLGQIYSSKWIRADYRGASLRIPFTVIEAGYYDISVNVMGDTFSGSLNDIPFKATAKPYLEKRNIGLYRLNSGDNVLSITLAPTGGIDSIELRKKSTAPEDFLRLAGVPGPADRLIDAKEAAAVLKNIQGTFTIRK